MAVRSRDSRLQFSKGDLIFQEHDLGGEAYRIEKGTIESYKGMGKERTVLGTMGRGEIFGELALFDNSRRMASAVAKTDAELLVINQKTLFKHFMAPPMVRMRVDELVNDHREITEKLDGLADYLKKLKKRYEYLYDLKEQNGVIVEGAPDVNKFEQDLLQMQIDMKKTEMDQAIQSVGEKNVSKILQHIFFNLLEHHEFQKRRLASMEEEQELFERSNAFLETHLRAANIRFNEIPLW